MVSSDPPPISFLFYSRHLPFPPVPPSADSQVSPVAHVIHLTSFTLENPFSLPVLHRTSPFLSLSFLRPRLTIPRLTQLSCASSLLTSSYVSAPFNAILLKHFASIFINSLFSGPESNIRHLLRYFFGSATVVLISTVAHIFSYSISQVPELPHFLIYSQSNEIFRPVSYTHLDVYKRQVP